MLPRNFWGIDQILAILVNHWGDKQLTTVYRQFRRFANCMMMVELERCSCLPFWKEGCEVELFRPGGGSAIAQVWPFGIGWKLMWSWKYVRKFESESLKEIVADFLSTSYFWPSRRFGFFDTCEVIPIIKKGPIRKLVCANCRERSIVLVPQVWGLKSTVGADLDGFFIKNQWIVSASSYFLVLAKELNAAASQIGK